MLKVKEFFDSRSRPLVMSMVVNAGFVPADHWVHSTGEGRSRIVGEMTHFLDLFQFLSGSMIAKVYAERIFGDKTEDVPNDNIVVTLKLTDGSVASLTYSASGNRTFSREQLTVFGEGKTTHTDGFRLTTLHEQNKTYKHKTSAQDMGYEDELRVFADVLWARIQSNLIISLINSMRFALVIELSCVSHSPLRFKGVRDACLSRI